MEMWPLLLCVVLMCDGTVGNATRGSFGRRHVGARGQRHVSFDADGVLKLDLDFNVPFISLPIQRSMDLGKTPLVKFNVASIMLAGAILFITTIGFPLLLGLINKRELIPERSPWNFMYSKTTRSDGLPFWKYLNTLDTTLLENNIDLTSCSQKLTCWAVKDSSKNVAQGRGSSGEKIFDGIISNEWFKKNMLNNVLEEAVNVGLTEDNCSEFYNKCSLSESNVYFIVNYLLKRFNRSY